MIAARQITFLSILVSCVTLVSCVDESPTVVVFDQELEAVTFENKLFTPIRIFRDGVIIDTLAGRSTRRYPINRKGIIRHAWRILAPTGSSGHKLGIEPYVDVGIQYDIEAKHEITYASADREIFTPRVGNSTPNAVKLFYVNYRESDEFLVDLVIPRGQFVDLSHAPYFYWHSESNVYVDNLERPETYRFDRDDTTSSGDPELELSDAAEYEGAGVTIPLIVD